VKGLANVELNFLPRPSETYAYCAFSETEFSYEVAHTAFTFAVSRFTPIAVSRVFYLNHLYTVSRYGYLKIIPSFQRRLFTICIYTQHIFRRPAKRFAVINRN
jgi:hypothetical protein